MRETVEIDVPPEHVTDHFSSDWMAVRANGEALIIHTPGERGATAYAIGEPTANPRVMATADAVLFQGTVGTTHYEDGLVSIQHTHAGVQERLPVDEHLADPVPTLDRTELVDLEGTGGSVEFVCSDCGDHVERERHQIDIPGLTPQRCATCALNQMGGQR